MVGGPPGGTTAPHETPPRAPAAFARGKADRPDHRSPRPPADREDGRSAPAPRGLAFGGDGAESDPPRPARRASRPREAGGANPPRRRVVRANRPRLDAERGGALGEAGLPLLRRGPESEGLGTSARVPPRQLVRPGRRHGQLGSPDRDWERQPRRPDQHHRSRGPVSHGDRALSGRRRGRAAPAGRRARAADAQGPLARGQGGGLDAGHRTRPGVRVVLRAWWLPGRPQAAGPRLELPRHPAQRGRDPPRHPARPANG